MESLPVRPISVWVKNRIVKNSSVIISINGGTGTGKTYTGIELGRQYAEELGTPFSIKDNMDFNFHKLLKKMQLPQNQKPGTVFIFEEVGSFESGASSRGWQSQANKFFFSFMQTSRHRNQILIFTCPHFSFLEKGARSLVHMQMEMAGINHAKRIAYVKPYRIQVNSRTGQFYFKYLRFTYKGKKHKLSRLEVPHPPQDMVDEYEIIKTAFTSALNKTIINAEETKEGHGDKLKEIGKDNAMLDKLLSNKVALRFTNKDIARLTGFHINTVSNRDREHKETTIKG